MADIKQCCPTDVQPVTSDYKGVGKIEKLKVGDEEIDMYVTGNGKKGIIHVYDIFGYHPNAFQVADLVAKNGFTVVIPDFFRKNPWATDNYPPKTGSESLMQWIGGYPYDTKIKPVFESATDFLKKQGASTFGAVGFCWGAKQCFLASKDNLVQAIAAAHPSFINNEDAEKLNGPACILPSGDDPEWEDIQSTLKKNKWAENNFWKRYPDMHHGWVAARGKIPTDFSDKKIANQAGEAISHFINFFEKTL